MKKLTLVAVFLLGSTMIFAQSKKNTEISKSSNSSSTTTSKKNTYEFGNPNDQASLEAARKHNETNAKREVQETRDKAASEGRPDPYAPKDKPVQATQQ